MKLRYGFLAWSARGFLLSHENCIQLNIIKMQHLCVRQNCYNVANGKKMASMFVHKARIHGRRHRAQSRQKSIATFSEYISCFDRVRSNLFLTTTA